MSGEAYYLGFTQNVETLPLRVYKDVSDASGESEADAAILGIFKAFAVAAIATSGRDKVAEVWNEITRPQQRKLRAVE